MNIEHLRSDPVLSSEVIPDDLCPVLQILGSLWSQGPGTMEEEFYPLRGILSSGFSVVC